MEQAESIIEDIARRTDAVILFHSASGKDSICLCDLLAKRFKRVVCVYMYVVKGLTSQERYISYATTKYPNVEFVQIPHYAWFSMVKRGYMGCAARPDLKLHTLADLTELVRGRTGLWWSFFGFKQNDSLNRRCMLRTYEKEAICEKTGKVYPLSSYSNKDVLRYIRAEGLMPPERYDNKQSGGVDISEVRYLLYLRDKFPNDLKKVISAFPLCERLLFEHDHKNNLEEWK